MAKAKEMATNWVSLAKDSGSPIHYKLAYDRSGTWSQKYNMVWDKAWKTELFSETLRNQEYNFYLGKLNTYGLPLDSRSSYTKSDWEMWTAALARNNTYFFRISDLVWKYVNETPSRVPLSDWYFTDGNGSMCAFRARSVIGGHWMKVYVDKILNGDIGTAIPSVQAQESDEEMVNGKLSNGKCFDLSGRQMVNGKWSNGKLPRGVYIKNGKKFVK